MARKAQRIRATLPAIATQIKASLTADRGDEISFSFKHLDLSRPKFVISEQDATYLSTLLSRLKEVCCLGRQDFLCSCSKTLRVHLIDWSETSEPDGFGFVDHQLASCDPVQFSLTANEHGRVHGFFIDTVFYIVWLDPNHRLYGKP